MSYHDFCHPRMVVRALLLCVAPWLLGPCLSMAKPTCGSEWMDWGPEPSTYTKWYPVIPVRVLTELVDEGGGRFGKKELAPGEFTEICVGLRAFVTCCDGEGWFGTSFQVTALEPGLGFSWGECRRRDPPCFSSSRPYLGPYTCHSAETEQMCSFLSSIISTGYSWVVEPGGKPYPPLVRRAGEEDVGYVCCRVRIDPRSRPGTYTIGCGTSSCCAEWQGCERNDDCGPVTRGWERRSFKCCCCPEPCQSDTLRVVPCVGDCEGDGQVTVDEVQRGVLVAVGLEAYSTCAAADGNEHGQVTVDELVRSVRNVLSSCVETALEEREAAQQSLAQTVGNGPAETKPALSLQGQSLEDADEDTTQ